MSNPLLTLRWIGHFLYYFLDMKNTPQLLKMRKKSKLIHRHLAIKNNRFNFEFKLNSAYKNAVL